VENIAIIGYFEKQTDLIRKNPVNLAGLQCPLFWAGGVARSKRRVGRYWLPDFKEAIAVHYSSISLKYLNCQY
jgi:hypothetical protein